MIALGRRSKTSDGVLDDLLGDGLGPEGFHEQADWRGLADRVRHLDLGRSASPAATTFLATQRMA